MFQANQSKGEKGDKLRVRLLLADSVLLIHAAPAKRFPALKTLLVIGKLRVFGPVD